MQDFADATVQRELQARIAALKSDAPARWGRMSAHEMLCHLTDSFRACVGQKAVAPVKQRFPGQGALTRWFALYVPIPWPKGVPAPREMVQGAGGTAPVEFEQDRRALLQQMKYFIAPAKRTPHPLFGFMNERDWMRWAYLHVDHHLRQFGV